MSSQAMENMLLKLKEQLNDGPNKIGITLFNSLEFIDVKTIVRCESDRSHTYLYLSCGRKVCSAKSLGEYEKVLTKFNFFRIHKSHLINLDYLQKYIKEDGKIAVMSDGAKIPVARRKIDIFNKKIFSYLLI